MPRREMSTLSPISLLVTLALAAVLGCAGEPPEPARNLLLITLDTLRADHLGVYGYDRPTSPNLDAFASGATVFEDVTCSMPTTLPSHISIFTGLRPSEHGVRRNGQSPDRDLVTIFDLLRQRGAATAAVIASQAVGRKYLKGMGLDEVLFPGSKRLYQTQAERVTDRAAAWLDGHHESPFALWVHYYDTHEPYAPGAPFARLFDRGYEGDLPDRLETVTLVGFNDLPDDERLSAADLAHVSDLYDAEIAYLDFHLGRLLTKVADLGRLDDTLVVIVGDHGQSLGDNSFFGHGLRLLEPVVQVPLVVRLPGSDRGRRVVAPVETVDLLPTVVELLALGELPDVAGRSLVPFLAGGSLPSRPFRLIERRTYKDRPEVRALALHGGAWKAVYYRDLDGSEQHLLGRRATGLDGRNLFTAESEEAQWLDSALTAFDAARDGTAEELDDEERRMLRSLGYLD